MLSDKVELVIHPVRLRITTALAGDALTTQELAERLPDIPKSSLYRHLRLLLEGGVLELAQTRLVQGIQEKVYRLAQDPHLGPDDVAKMTPDEHFRTFTTYVLTLLREFSVYLTNAAGRKEEGTVDLAGDHVGYTETVFFASDEELVPFLESLQAAFALLPEEAGPGRTRRKVALITHPLPDFDRKPPANEAQL